jgi:hypothetical protein
MALNRRSNDDGDKNLDPAAGRPLLGKSSNPDDREPSRLLGSIRPSFDGDNGPPGPLGLWGDRHPIIALVSVTLLVWWLVTFTGICTWIVIPNFWTPLFVVAISVVLVLRSTSDQYAESNFPWELAIFFGALAGAFSAMTSGLFLEEWLSLSIHAPIRISPSNSYVF